MYKRQVQDGDLVVITAGVPLGIPGTTNLLKVQTVGDVILHGTGIGEGTLRAALAAGITVQANAPTPVAPSMADVYKRQVYGEVAAGPPQIEEQPVALEMYILSPNSWVIRRA